MKPYAFILNGKSSPTKKIFSHKKEVSVCDIELRGTPFRCADYSGYFLGDTLSFATALREYIDSRTLNNKASHLIEAKNTHNEWTKINV